MNHPQTPPEITTNMASDADDSKLPSLYSLVPPCGNDSQRYSDGLLQLFSGQNWPLAAAATARQTQTRRVNNALCRYIANK